LFRGGYCACSPIYYYRQLAFANEHKNHENPLVRSSLISIRDSLKELREAHAPNIRTVNELALKFDIKLAPEPEDAESYNQWLRTCTEGFEAQFPMSRMEYYYFFYGRKLAEIRSNVMLAKTYLALIAEVNGSLELESRIKGCVKDCEYSLFRLIAASALLSSEPRHTYFSVNYKTLNQEFDPFRVITGEGSGLKDKKLLRELDGYKDTLENGYQKCVELLLELEV
jgi:hypothetical protein